MITYYVNNSIHQIPSFIYIARALGGTVFTTGPDSYEVLRSHYADVPAEYCPSLAEARARLEELRPEAVVQPDYSRRELALTFPTVHVQVFHGTSDKHYNLSHNVRDYDLLLLAGEQMRSRLAVAGFLKPGNHAVVGYPKADRVFTGELRKDESLARLDLDPTRPTVLYAPTWRDNKGNSSLAKFSESLLRELPDEYNLIVKLHPNTAHYDHRYYPLILRLTDGKPNVRMVGFEHDVFPIMAAADLLLCDVSSVAHEFLCFDCPLVFLDPRRLPVGEREKTWVWRSGRVVRRPGEVWEAVADELSCPERYSRQRQECFSAIYYQPDGRAAERAAEAISSFLAQRRPLVQLTGESR